MFDTRCKRMVIGQDNLSDPPESRPQERDARLPLVRNGAPCRILIVEDDALIALDLQQTIEDLGGMVVGRASRTPEAIGLAAKYQPDVVLMDIRLAGGSDGIDAARGIRRLRPTPIIFVTGNTDPVTRGRVLEFGDAPLLNKPVDQALLRSILHERCAAQRSASPGAGGSKD
jgi:CheY-like chemotaxis protein